LLTRTSSGGDEKEFDPSTALALKHSPARRGAHHGRAPLVAEDDEMVAAQEVNLELLTLLARLGPLKGDNVVAAVAVSGTVSA
jgi:hypothetical protein